MLKEQYKESQDRLSKAKGVRTNLVRAFTSLADCVSSSSNLKISCSKKNRQKRAEELAWCVDALQGFALLTAQFNVFPAGRPRGV